MSVKIIAEIAQGYEGDVDLAKLLVKAACKTKTDAVKLQCVYVDELAVPAYKHYKLFKSLEMATDVWADLVEMAHYEKKEIYFDIFGKKSLEIALASGVDGVKLHSTDFFNDELAQEVFLNFNKIFVSIGGIELSEIREFLDRYNTGDKDLCLMFGHQAEPTPIHDNNINRLKILAEEFRGVKLGFMDHSEFCSEEVQTLSLLALPCGVDYIEKHITLDHKLLLEDYVSAITPTEFDIFINRIETHERALGENNFILDAGDLEYRNRKTKVIVAGKDLVSRHQISQDDIALKRVNYTNTRPECFRVKSDVVGKTTNRLIKENELISYEDLK